MKEKKFSLILATYGRESEVKEFLESVSNSNYDKRLIEIIIVDQNEKINLMNIVDKYKKLLNIKYIKSKVKGLSINRNIGLKEATGEIIAFPDDDCEYLVETFQILNKLFIDDIDVLMGRIVERDGSDSLRSWPKEKIKITENNFYSKCSSVTLFIRRETGIYYFDEELGVGQYFGACEDASIIYKNTKKKLNVIYNPEICIYHPHYDSSKNMSNEKIQSYGLGFGAMVRKNFSLSMAILFLKAEIYHLLKMSIGMISFNKEKMSRSWIALRSRIRGFLEYEKSNNNNTIL